MEGRLEPADGAYMLEQISERWGFPVVTIYRTYEREDAAKLEGLVYRDEWEQPMGLITWCVEGEWAEIVTVDAFEQGRHIGGRLLDGAEAEFRRRGVRRVGVVTTNDNLRALAFYVRRGFRLVRLELDGMDRVRARKPHIPLTGLEGLPLRDMLGLEKELL